MRNSVSLYLCPGHEVKASRASLQTYPQGTLTRPILSTGFNLTSTELGLVGMVLVVKKTLMLILSCVVGAGLSLGGISPAYADSPRTVAPILGSVVRGFDPPDQPWLAGHRGVDVLSEPGQAVAAAMDGVVSFAGTVVGRPVISLNHGDLTTTYEPVEASVSPGEFVLAGQTIGTLISGHTCPGDACLHWGLKRGDTYLDPLSLLEHPKIRLLSSHDMDQIRSRAADMTRYGVNGRVSAAGLVTPVTGVVTDVYGMRLHPIDKVWKFHDGLDIGAACGSPIVASAAGTVTMSAYSGGYGYRLVIEHGTIDGHALKTAYNHAQSFAVPAGAHVSQGQLVGWVGSTGTSTGCHLHFQTWVDGVSTDPQLLLPG